jgi:hypothetical protein
MRKFTIKINNRVYETTNASDAWCFVSFFAADRMFSERYEGLELPHIMFIKIDDEE